MIIFVTAQKMSVKKEMWGWWRSGDKLRDR
jgi:hypothetical protein